MKCQRDDGGSLEMSTRVAGLCCSVFGLIIFSWRLDYDIWIYGWIYGKKGRQERDFSFRIRCLVESCLLALVSVSEVQLNVLFCFISHPFFVLVGSRGNRFKWILSRQIREGGMYSQGAWDCKIGNYMVGRTCMYIYEYNERY